MFPLLILDAHRYAASVVLLCSPNQFVTRQYSAGKDHLSQLHRMIYEVCDEAKLTLRELSTMACTVGPGAYTSARVSVSIAESLAYGLGCLSMPLCSLQAIAMSKHLAVLPADVWVAMDARQGRIYTALYRVNVDFIEVVQAPQCILLDDMPDYSGENLHLCGDGWSLLPKLCQQNFPLKPLITPQGLAKLSYLQSIEETGCFKVVY